MPNGLQPATEVVGLFAIRRGIGEEDVQMLVYRAWVFY
jgi:hypothetical protein